MNRLSGNSKTIRWLGILILVCMAVTATPASGRGLFGLGPGSGDPDQAPPAPDVQTDPDVDVNYRPNGLARQVIALAPSGRPAGFASQSPETAARDFLDQYGRLFGLENPDAELVVKSVKPAGGAVAGSTVVRFQQVVEPPEDWNLTQESLPVLGGELVAQVSEGETRSVNGEVSTSPQLGDGPRLPAVQAGKIARLQTAKWTGAPVEALEASEPELWLYDPQILGGPGMAPAPVWMTTVSGTGVRELVLVDSRSGSVVLHFSQNGAARDRSVFDNNNSPSAGLPGFLPVRQEGGPAASDAEANNAYDYSGAWYDFFASVHDRDSIDNRGMKVVTTVQYCPPSGACPYENAFWSGAGAVFGQGYADADDVVAHELTHGMIEYESGLFYYMQSGAIADAMANLWGEIIDQGYSNGNDSDALADRWLIGEDLPGGPVANMQDPTLDSRPDRTRSPLYACTQDDNGGAHANSGVGDKAAYLMVDGGTFNGFTVAPLGAVKTAHIWYHAQTDYLTSASDYPDLAAALSNACRNLVGTNGITAADCDETDQAIAAVEMPLAPACSSTTVGLCETGIMNETFNDGVVDGWTPVQGTWQSDGAYLYTTGVDGEPSSIAFNSSHRNIDVTVTMRRFGDNKASSGLILRGVPYPLQSQNWSSGYVFEYARNGQFSVWRMDQGEVAVLKPWTFSPAVLTGDNWNTLRVLATDQNLKYYINGTLVWSGANSRYLTGQLGLRMYRPAGGVGDRLEVDAISVASPGSTIPLDLFSDSFENPLSGKWMHTPGWFYPQSANPYSYNPFYTSSGEYGLWGEGVAPATQTFAFQNLPVSLPAGKRIYLNFNHAYDFEKSTQGNLDGGRLEYSTVVTSTTWQDAGTLFTENGYNGMIAGGTGNLYAGYPAFVGASYGMHSSRLDLSSLGGSKVRFRFYLTSDDTGTSPGWFIDDVRLYTCDAYKQIYMPFISFQSSQGTIYQVHSAFTDYNSLDWQAHSGNWRATPRTYSVYGLANQNVTASYSAGEFKNFSFEARVRRTGLCDTCATTLYLRGSPTLLDDARQWNSGYFIQFNRLGYFAVYKRVDGAFTTVVPWTYHPDILTGDSWNIAQVIANGKMLTFSMNNRLIWSGTDASLAAGRVGLGMYSDTTWDRLDVDYVSVISLP